jgi:hypothetical protein
MNKSDFRIVYISSRRLVSKLNNVNAIQYETVTQSSGTVLHKTTKGRGRREEKALGPKELDYEYACCLFPRVCLLGYEQWTIRHINTARAGRSICIN